MWLCTTVKNYSLIPEMLHNILPAHTHTFSILAPGDYGGLNNFRLGPFSSGMCQLSFNVSTANDNTTEDAETFSARLTLDPADQARLVNRVRVSPDVATVTVQDDNGKHA